MEIKVHLALIASVVLCAFVAGLLFRAIQLKALRRQILELEDEKMHDHAEILQLQKKLSSSQSSKSGSSGSTPVVPLKDKDSAHPDNGNPKRATK